MILSLFYVTHWCIFKHFIFVVTQFVGSTVNKCQLFYCWTFGLILEAHTSTKSGRSLLWKNSWEEDTGETQAFSLSWGPSPTDFLITPNWFIIFSIFDFITPPSHYQPISKGLINVYVSGKLFELWLKKTWFISKF